MLPTDPLTKTNIFQFPIVARQIIANIVLVGLAAILVGLRFVTRRIRKTKIWWDDLAIVVALIYVIGLLVTQITFANHGMRYHTVELPLANMTFLLKRVIALQSVYYAGMAFAKISYLWFYLRIFPQQNFRKWVWICMGLVAGYWLGSMLQMFLLCRPFEMNWNPTIPGGHCGNSKVAFVSIGIFNMLTDLIIMLLPLPFIRRLQMATGTKIGLAAIFGIGLFVTGISIIRIDVLVRVDYTDISFYTDAVFWSVTEPAVAVINCCIATLRPLLRLVSPSRFWSSEKGDTTDRIKLTDNISSGKMSNNKNRVYQDEFPLTCNEDGITNTVITCGETEDSLDTKAYTNSDHSLKNNPSMERSWDVEREIGSRPERVRSPERGRIHVQQQYTVETQNAEFM